MTHHANNVALAVQLGNRGLGATEISKRLGVPRSTVRDWLHGRIPIGRRGTGDTCDACGHAPHNADELPRKYVYLLGTYLGDGCISAHPRGVFKLRIFLDAGYPRIVDEVAEAMRAVRPQSKVGQSCHSSSYTEEALRTCTELFAYSRSWPCLFPQHGPGKKHHRRILLADWQRPLIERYPWLLLRGLIHSDGTRFINTGRGGWRNPRYAFTNLSSDIRGIFCDVCEQLGLHWTWARPKTIYVSRKADVARMDEFVGPKA
jgi:hypothetical protein